MNFIVRFIARLTPSVDTITANLQSTVDRLQKLAETNRAKAKAIDERIEILAGEAADLDVEAERADKVAAKVNKLLA